MGSLEHFQSIHLCLTLVTELCIGTEIAEIRPASDLIASPYASYQRWGVPQRTGLKASGLMKQERLFANQAYL